ncbi:MAG: metallophosphoesterase [Gemmatimonadota bacterium]
MRLTLTLSLLASLIVAPAGTAPQAGSDVTFVVLGHLRGEEHGLNHKIAEVLSEVRRVKPDAVFLTGDIIWGDYHNRNTDSAAVEAEWTEIDSALATLGVPVYRVPGNHDINDAVTRDIWNRRYGARPQTVTIRGNRFLLLASGWVPEPGDTGKALYIRGKDLDQRQVEFLRRELAQPNSAGHTFVVMHHLLWWESDTASWWREVHPLLASGRVSMVFSGDYGPLKFSALNRDGVQYLQSSIEDSVPMIMQRNRIPSRVLSSQFDNFLVVSTRGPEVSLDVRTVAAVSSGQFTPSRYHEINQIPPSRPAESLGQRAWELVGSPKRLVALLLGVGTVFAAGMFVGRMFHGGK